MKINLDLVEIFTNLEKTECVRQSIRKDLANLIFTQGTGLACHALAIKIFNGSADDDFNESEVALISEFVNRCCSPAIIDAVQKMLKAEKKD